MEAILVVNAGSSSLKFQIFDCETGVPKGYLRGQIDGIGLSPRLRVEDEAGDVLIDEISSDSDIPDLPHALLRARRWLQESPRLPAFRAIGHRIVHGGPDYAEPLLIDRQVLDHLRRYQNLAPLHQPNNLAPVELAIEINPALPQVACFDTAFHRGHDTYADCYALPWRFYEQGVRRYGFHGLSYEYSAHKLRELAPEVSAGRVIAAHLGSGASMCALLNGRSVESTMGFTALDGLPMGTRPGQVDAGVVLHLIMQEGMEPGGGQRPALPSIGPQRNLRHFQRYERPPGEQRSAGRAGHRPFHPSRGFVCRNACRCNAGTRRLRLHGGCWRKRT